MRSAPTWLWLVLLFMLGITIFFALGMWETMDPHVKGWVGRHGDYHRYEDDGERAMQACLLLAVVVVGASGIVRLVQMQRKEVADRRWLWEVVVDGQVVQRPPPTVDNIRDDMNGFDGRLAACDLLDKDTGARVWCYGEPDRRVVEVRRFSDGSDGSVELNGDYRLARRDCQDTAPVELAGPRPVSVAEREVLTAAQALEIVLAMFTGQPIPDTYAWERFDAR
jgi:hypothetical protein